MKSTTTGQARGKIISKKIIDTYFEEIAYDDYDFSENDGYVDHEMTICKVCQSGEGQTRGAMLEHFWKNHAELAMQIKKGNISTPFTPQDAEPEEDRGKGKTK